MRRFKMQNLFPGMSSSSVRPPLFPHSLPPSMMTSPLGNYLQLQQQFQQHHPQPTSSSSGASSLQRFPHFAYPPGATSSALGALSLPSHPHVPSSSSAPGIPPAWSPFYLFAHGAHAQGNVSTAIPSNNVAHALGKLSPSSTTPGQGHREVKDSLMNDSIESLRFRARQHAAVSHTAPFYE